jgi:hypothetical protein
VVDIVVRIPEAATEVATDTTTGVVTEAATETATEAATEVATDDRGTKRPSAAGKSSNLYSKKQEGSEFSKMQEQKSAISSGRWRGDQ